jgi:hypothetical protein
MPFFPALNDCHADRRSAKSFGPLGPSAPEDAVLSRSE